MKLKANTINIMCKITAVLVVLIALILRIRGLTTIAISEVVTGAAFIAAAFVGVDISKVGVAIRTCMEKKNNDQ